MQRHVALAHQETGDNEAADDEEDVDADVAPGEVGNARVGQDDQDDRDRPKALDVGAEALRRWDHRSSNLGLDRSLGHRYELKRATVRATPIRWGTSRYTRKFRIRALTVRED